MVMLNLHDREVVGAAVSAEDTAALVACFGHGDAADAELTKHADGFLVALRARGEWLACDCRGAAVEVPPLMAPRLREGGIHIWRFGETPHAMTCPFFVEPDTSLGPAAGVRDARQCWKGDWLLLREPVDRSRRGPSRSPNAVATGARRPKRLARLLDAALTEAGYTVVAPGDTVTRKGHTAISRERDAYAALRSLDDKMLADRVTWRDVGCSFLPALRRHMARLADVKFPAGVRPQGLFLGVVDEILRNGSEGPVLLWRGGKDARVSLVHVEGRVTFSSNAEFGAGPFWVMAQLARVGAGDFAVTATVAQPCLSRAVLLPVGSNEDRRLAETLLAQINYWVRPQSRNVAVQLEKPLFPETSEDGAELHAAFVLWMPGARRIVIPPTNAPREQLASWKHRPGVVAVLQPPVDADPFTFARKLTAVVAGTVR